MGVPYVKDLRAITKKTIDAHLMVSNPSRLIPWFIDAGADVITVHIEAYMQDGEDWEEAQSKALADMKRIQAADRMAAIAIKPKTPVRAIAELIPAADMVLVMSVEPGFSGQGYIDGSEERVAEVASIAKDSGASPLIQVDGGIGPATAPLVARMGADVFVSGNYILKADDPESAMLAIRDAAEAAR